MSAYGRTRRARKPWRCAFGANCTIQPGERYVDEVMPPWTEIVDDVDDEGRPCGSEPLGTWVHERFHAACYGAMVYG
jgi:hypothetical protein